MTKWLINCGHSGMLWGHYLTQGKQSPNVPPGIYEGEFNREIGKRLNYLLPNSRLLTPGPCNVTQATRRKNVNLIASLENDVILLSVHANAAQNSGWQDRVSGARVFVRKRPFAAARLADYSASVQIAQDISQAFKDGPLPYSVRPVKEMNFGILKVKCPSVLVECGFHTNRIDAAYMASENGRDEIADMIASGVK